MRTKKIIFSFLIVLVINTSVLAQNNGLNFSASNSDHVILGDLDLTTFTLEAWVNFPDVGLNTILSKGEGQPNQDNYIVSINNGLVSLYIVIDGSGAWYTSTTKITNNDWTHIAVSFDQPTGEVKFYIDGAFDASDTAPLGDVYQDNSPAFIGRQGTSCNCNFANGSIDELRIWSTVRTCEEIKSNRKNELQGSELGLVSYFNFNQGSAGGNNTSEIVLLDQIIAGLPGVLSPSFSLNGTISNWIDASGTGVSGTTPLLIPEVLVSGNAVQIFHNSSPTFSNFTTLPQTLIGNTSTRNFTIRNIGLQVLTIAQINITGINSADFSVTSFPSSLNSTQSGVVTVEFTSNSLGTKEATLNIVTANCDPEPFKINIEAEGISNFPGAALNFDGINDHITLSNSNVLDFDIDDKFTLQFWFSTASNSNQVIFSKQLAAFPFSGYEVSMNAGRINFSMINNAMNNLLVVTTTNSFDDGNWHQGTIMYKGIPDGSTVDIFVDDVLQGKSNPNNTLSNSISSLTTASIGARANGAPALFFNGSLDEVRIWNRVFCVADIPTFSTCEVQGNQNGLLAYYTFNQGIASSSNTGNTSLVDLAGGNNNGTLVNFELASFTSNWVAPGGVITSITCGPLLFPTLQVEGNSLPIQNRINTPIVGDNTDFGGLAQGQSKDLEFFIRNTGQATLSLISVPLYVKFSSGSADFSVTIQPSTPISFGANNFSKFQLTFTPNSTGPINAIFVIGSNDCNTPLFYFNVKGTGIFPPDIFIQQGASEIAINEKYNIGTYTKLTNSPPFVFTIENKSKDLPLLFQGVPPIFITGANPEDFTIDQSTLPQSIAPLSSATFSVVFRSFGAGERATTLIIKSNDPDESTYFFQITAVSIIVGDLDLDGIITVPEVAGDISGDKAIGPGELAGDVNGDGLITAPFELLGDANGNGILDSGEIAGDVNGDFIINYPQEIAGDLSGNGVIGGSEFAGDVNGNGLLDPFELIGDSNGNGILTPPEIAGDINGDGNIDPAPIYSMVGKQIIATNIVAQYRVIPPLPPYYTYAWVFSDNDMVMIKDTTRSFMDILALPNSNGGILTCYVFQFGLPFDTLFYPIEVNKNSVTIFELALLDSACALVYSASNRCESNFIDYFKLRNINYENNGCIIGGYQDLTASKYSTELEMGMNYTVELKPNRLLFNIFGEATTLFYGIWIDYNNDGDFEDAFEFLKSGESDSLVAKLINISIANNKLYEGSRRLRVGMRSTGGFSNNDACSVVGESGELEDYLVTLVPMGRLEGTNFLTPNDDGYNDFLIVRGVDANLERILTVITKTGSLVYQEENYNNTWQATYTNGERVPKGTYYYIYKNGSNELKSFVEIDY